ncbi:MAG: oxygenase MpaB family protein [Polyangiaceae bacterium]
MTVAPIFRLVGDPPLDALVAGLGLRPREAWLPLRGENDSPFDEAVPQELRRWLEATRDYPVGAARVTALRAQRFADRHLPELSVSLLAGALPFLFTGAKGAAVLHETRRLLDDVDRRVNETGRFVLEVVRPGGFEPCGHALRACQSTRLVHAIVRASVRAPGVAINQEDALGTLLAFSVVALRGMTRLGVRSTEQDAEAWWQLWRLVGECLGVDARILPARYDEAAAELDAFWQQRASPSPQGRALTEALLDGIARHLGSSERAAQLVRHLIGDRVADLLGVEEARGHRDPIVGLFTRHGRAASETLGPRLARWLLESIVETKLRPP